VSRDVRRFLLLACPLFVLAACAVGNRIYISGEPSRPAAPRRPAEAPQAVVLDFAYVAAEPGVVGRDYDQVRPIEWKGEPGKAMADLVASVLAEGGVAAVRAAAESPSLDTVPIRISGTVGRFEVNARRRGTVKIVNEATVSLSVTAAGGTLSAPVSFSATSTNSMEDVFVTPDGLRNVLFSAANAAAEEAGRRLFGAGVVAPPPSGK
jgi:hypothetical protein